MKKACEHSSCAVYLASRRTLALSRTLATAATCDKFRVSSFPKRTFIINVGRFLSGEVAYGTHHLCLWDMRYSPILYPFSACLTARPRVPLVIVFFIHPLLRSQSLACIYRRL